MRMTTVASLMRMAMMVSGFTPRIRRGSTPNKHNPHQGDQECARRGKQRLMMEGRENGYKVK